jgi:hypothetical protein
MWTCIYTSGIHMQAYSCKEEVSGAGSVKTLVCVCVCVCDRESECE